MVKLQQSHTTNDLIELTLHAGLSLSHKGALLLYQTIKWLEGDPGSVGLYLKCALVGEWLTVSRTDERWERQAFEIQQGPDVKASEDRKQETWLVYRGMGHRWQTEGRAQRGRKRSQPPQKHMCRCTQPIFLPSLITANSVGLKHFLQFSSVQSLSRILLFSTPWTAALQASLSITNSQSLLKLMSIESVMPSNHLIFCHPFSSRLQSFLTSGSFQMSPLFTSGGQSIGVSASASVLPMSIQD